MKLYIGNLSYNAKEEDIRKMLERFGPVDSLDWLTDEFSGKCRGFCFAQMNNSDADAAIKALNHTEFMGRTIKINEARAKKGRKRRHRF